MRRMMLLAVGAVAVVVVAVFAAGCGGGGSDSSTDDTPPPATTEASAATRSASVQWVIRDLGTLGGSTSRAVAVNERGQVVGDAAAGFGGSHAFVWQNGRMTDLGVLGGSDSQSWARWINDRGQIIGTNMWPSTSQGSYHPILWQKGRMIDLTKRGLTVQGTYDALNSGEGAVGINNSGQIAGMSAAKGDPRAYLWSKGKMNYLDQSFSSASALNDRGQIIGRSTYAFVWEKGKMTDLGTLGGRGSSLNSAGTYAGAINNQGQIVGWSTTAAGDQHAFLWQNGKMTDLGTLGGRASGAYLINGRGQIAGWSDTGAVDANDRPIKHASLWQNGKVTDLGTLGGETNVSSHERLSSAYAMNERGLIVGESQTKSGASHAFVWQNGKIVDLGTLGGKESGSWAINNHNQVVGWATTKNGQQHAVLWTLRSG